MVGQPKARTGCCHAVELINNIFKRVSLRVFRPRVLSAGLQLGARVANAFPDGDVRARCGLVLSGRCVSGVSFSRARKTKTLKRNDFKEADSRRNELRRGREGPVGEESVSWTRVRDKWNRIRARPRRPRYVVRGTTHDERR